MISGTTWTGGVEVLERERERERIEHAITAAREGTGSVLLVEGPAGIGKTTLARVARDLAQASGLRVLRAAGRQLEQDYPYGIVRQLFDPVLRGADPAERTGLMDGAAAAAAALQLTPGPGEEAGSEFATLHGLYWLLANLSDEHPLLLIADDAHWADRASLRFLAFLAPRLVELPILLLICARSEEWEPEELFAATASDIAASPIVPAPLSTEACALLVGGRFGPETDRVFTEACQTATGGNPFLLSALLDELSADRTAPRAENAEGVLAMGPRVVTRAIVARLGRLVPSARPFAAALAVLGDGAGSAELAELSGLRTADLREARDALQRAGILDAGERLQFAHPIIRNAVYGELPLAERDRLHREAAVLLERSGAPVERVAAHLLASDPAGDPDACATLRRAGDAALATGASHSGVAYLRRALAEPCPEEDRVALLMELGAAERLIDGQAAIAHLRDALELNADSGRHVEIANLLAWVLVFAAQAEDAVATAARALAKLGDGEEQRDLRRRLEATVMLAGSHDPAQAEAGARLWGQMEAIGQEPGLGARRIQSMLLMQEQRTLAHPAAVLAERAQALLADGLPLREDNGGTSFINAVQVLMAADSELALEWLDRGLDRARRTGDGYAAACDLLFRTVAHLRRGDLHDAMLDATEAQRGIDQWGIRIGSVWCTSLYAHAQVDGGDLDGAARTLAAIEPEDGEAPRTIGWATFEVARVALRMARGDWPGCLEASRQLARHYTVPHPVWTPWRSAAALSLTALEQDPEEARELIDTEVEVARRWGSPGALGPALRARGIVLGDRDGEESLREAVAVLDGSSAKLESARALVELGAMLRRTARRKEGREPLRAGLKLARSCGANQLAERAVEELRAAGESPRTVTRSGASGLTASERRVAQMAAEGMSNKQIAQTLYVTVKTVETHLHRVFQKLDVSSRAQLGEALAAAS